MNDLRREMHEALERQQSQLGDVTPLTNRMLRIATQRPVRRGQLVRSLAGVAIVLLAAAAVGTTVVLRNLHPRSVTVTRPTPSASALPSATPAPTPLSQALNVPSTTPVLLYHDPVSFQQIDGITWDGSARGRVGDDPLTGTGILPNPDGSLWATTRDIRDRTGAVVSALPATTKGFPGIWADDNRHYCTLAGPNPVGQVGGVPTTLQLVAVGQAPRNIAQVGRAYEQTSVGVAACSVLNDRAVVAQANSIGEAVQFWVVQLSTGRVLWTRTSGDIRASRDGRYIAEMIADQSRQHWQTTIFSTTGSVLGHLNGRIEVFSWDGSLAVQVANFGAAASVVNWRTGAMLWTGPSNAGFYEAMPEPGGSRLAVSLRDPSQPQTGGFPAVNIYIVSSDGKAVGLLTDVMQ